MKKLLALVILLISLQAAFSQGIPGYTYIAQRYEWYGGLFKALGTPAGDSPAFIAGQNMRAGALYYDSVGADSGLYVWSGLAWRNYDPAALTASQGITKVGSDFQLGGTATTQRTVTFDNGNKIFQLNPTAGNSADVRILAIDSIVNNPEVDSEANTTAFSSVKVWRYPSYSSTYYRLGNNLGVEFQSKDSVRINSYGGDFGAGSRTNMAFTKMAGYSGRSVYVMGNQTLNDALPVHLNNVEFAPGSSTTSNYRYVKGYVTGTQSYLYINPNDTLENWMGFNNMGFFGGGHIKFSADYVGGYFGSAAVARVANPWGVFIWNARSKNYFAGALAIGDSIVDPSATLDISSTTKGMLPPRMSAAQRSAIGSPGPSLFLWDNDSTRYMGYNGTVWKGIAWTDETGSSSPLTNTYVGVGDASNLLSGSNQLVFSGGELRIGNADFGSNSFQTTGSIYANTFISAAGLISGQYYEMSPLAVAPSTSSPSIYYNTTTDKYQVRNTDLGVWEDISTGAGGGTWGSITGTLSDQTDLQAALDAKAPLASPTFTGTITTPLTASRAVVTGASSELAASATTATEIGYLSGVTSAIQTQLDGKVSGSLTSTRIPFATGANTLSDDASMTWDNTGKKITIGTGTAVGGLVTINGGNQSAGSSQIHVQQGGVTGLFLGTGNSGAHVRASDNKKLLLQTNGSASLDITAFGTGGMNITSQSSTGINYNASHATTGSHIFQTATVTRAIINNSGLNLAEQAAPSTPATGFTGIYSKSDGLVYAKDDAGTETKLSNDVTASGKFLPAFTNVTNITASTPDSVMYTRVGNIVTVSGLLSVTPTSSSSLVELRMTLPISSALTAPEQVAGPAANQQNVAGHIAGDETNDAAMFRWIATGTTSFQFRFTYTYQIL